MSDCSEAVLLAGGAGKRLKPFSTFTSKHLLPIDNVPMIFYPLKNLQLIGIKKTFLIINQEHKSQWEKLINMYSFNMEIKLVIQEKPLGIPDAITYCESYIKGDNFIVALGDNVIVATNFLNNFKSIESKHRSTICGFNVSDPTAFGVARFDNNNKLIEVTEKPKVPPSKIAIAGFYRFPRNAFDYIKDLEFSERGELEITDLINIYIKNDLCDLVSVSSSPSDYWIDTGTQDALVKATNFIRDLKRNSGLDIAQFSEKEF